MNIIPVFIPHIGCPYECIFCNQNEITSSRYNFEEIKNTIETALLYTTNAEIAYYGGSFTATSKTVQGKLLNLAIKYIDGEKVIGIRLSTRPDYINDEILSFLKEKGVTTIELGAQSMNDDILKKANRGHTSSHVEKAAKLIKDYGFSLGLQVMTGLPLDNMEESIKTAEKIASLKPDFTRIYPVIVLPDTKLYELYKSGEYKALTIEEAVINSAHMLRVFRDNNIKVIRIGINPSTELESSVVAGAYHPALGEMIYSRLIFMHISEYLSDKDDAGILEIYCHKSMVSKLVGQKRGNIRLFDEKYPNIYVKIYNDFDIKSSILLKYNGKDDKIIGY